MFKLEITSAEAGLAMIKKAVLATSGVFLLTSLSVGMPLWSYARCGWDWMRVSTTEMLPLEWEIQRARQMITDLKPEIEENAKKVAREKVEVTRLKQQFDEASMGLEKSREQIERLTADLKAGGDKFTYGGTTYTAAQVESDLSSRFKRFKTKNATASKLEQVLQARQVSLKATQDRMTTMLDARRQLEVEVENLEARLGALRVAQTATGISLDDSQLAKTRGLLDEIAVRIDVQEESVAVDTEYFDQIDLNEDVDSNLVDEIAEFLNRGSEQDETHALVAIQLD